MNRLRLEEILNAFKDGKLTTEDVVQSFRDEQVADIGFAQVDLDRGRRRGVPEVVFGESKTPEQIAEIMRVLSSNHQRALATRVDAAAGQTIINLCPELPLVYDPTARCIYTEGENPDVGIGTILVVCAGTSDLPVAAEAALTARLCGNTVEMLTDVGVSGLHRLLGHLDTIRAANVVVVCAGMEGALPSVVAGLVSRPIVAVPTSVGYGASFEGMTALLSMMNSCAAGVTVVNIDNGFGAGYAASVINRRLVG